MSTQIRETMVAVKGQQGAVKNLGTVREIFKGLPFYLYTKNRPAMKFIDKEMNKEFLIVLSNSLQAEYDSGNLTPAMFWNLNVYETRTNPQGEPLTDKFGNVIEAIYSMGTEQTTLIDSSKMDDAKLDKKVYQAHGEDAFDDLF